MGETGHTYYCRRYHSRSSPIIWVFYLYILVAFSHYEVKTSFNSDIPNKEIYSFIYCVSQETYTRFALFVVLYLSIVPISSRVCSLTLGHWYNCPSATDTSLNDIGHTRACDMTLTKQSSTKHVQIDGLVQNCNNSSALAMELLQSCTKPSICCVTQCTMYL